MDFAVLHNELDDPRGFKGNFMNEIVVLEGIFR